MSVVRTIVVATRGAAAHVVALGLACGCLLTGASRPAAAQGYRFANIPWGANGPAIKDALAAQGLNFVEVDSDGDYKFKGTLSGYDAVVWGLMSDAGVAKFSITLFTPDEKARQAYRDMKGFFTTKYGAPVDVVESYDAPYHDGDGHEEQAIREDKGHFLSLWREPVGADTSYLGLQITEKLNLFVAYEGPHWSAELDRRRAKAKQNSPF
jgi:hypothetical protein